MPIEVTEIMHNSKIIYQSLQKKRLLLDLDGVICEFDFPKIVSCGIMYVGGALCHRLEILKGAKS